MAARLTLCLQRQAVTDESIRFNVEQLGVVIYVCNRGIRSFSREETSAEASVL